MSEGRAGREPTLVGRPQRRRVEYPGLRHAELTLQAADRLDGFGRVHTVDRAGVEAEIGEQLLDAGHRVAEQGGDVAVSGTQRGIGGLVVHTRHRDAEVGLKGPDRGRDGLAVDPVDRSFVVTEDGEDLLQPGDEDRFGEGFRLEDLVEIDIGRRDLLERRVSEASDREPGFEDVTLLVEADAAADALIVDVVAGLEIGRDSPRTSNRNDPPR